MFTREELDWQAPKKTTPQKLAGVQRATSNAVPECASPSIYRPADKKKGGESWWLKVCGGTGHGGRGSLSCRDHCTKHCLYSSSTASCVAPGAFFLLTAPCSLPQNVTLVRKERTRRESGRKEEEQKRRVGWPQAGQQRIEFLKSCPILPC